MRADARSLHETFVRSGVFMLTLRALLVADIARRESLGATIPALGVPPVGAR